MRIIETCPVCGHDLTNIILTSYPSRLSKVCYHCGWSWREDQDDIVRVPFCETYYKVPSACRTCSNHPSNGGSGVCHCVLGAQSATCVNGPLITNIGDMPISTSNYGTTTTTSATIRIRG